MKRYCLKVALLIVLVTLGTFRISAQTQREIDELYRDGNSYFYFEDYEEALALYLRVYTIQPNSNLDFRIGFCYLNIPGSRHRAIEYLERASNETSRRYNENSIKEQNAPIDAIFYLGNAYFINNQLGKAEAAYNRFHSEMKSERAYNMMYFNHQMEGLKVSRNLQKFPVNFVRTNMGQEMNDRFSNFNPVVSGNGKVMAYTTKRRFQNVVFIARKVGNSWGTPQNITLDLVVDGNCSTLSLSQSGNTLYLFRDDGHDGNIYVSDFVDGKWTPIQKLNNHINTPSYETHAYESPDGKKLYFSSNRPGGLGDLDIYVSNRLPNGDWGPATNLGPTINTSFNETAPFLTPDGSLLFFSSEGHNTIGGYDIFFSQRSADGGWENPINMGYPLNTTDDENFYQPIGDGSTGYMALYETDGYGEMDIFRFDVFLPKYQRTLVTQSDMMTQKTNVFSNSVVVDTVSNPGFALIDLSRIESLNFLDPSRRSKLFLDGKRFELGELVRYDVVTKPETPLAASKEVGDEDKLGEAKKLPSDLELEAERARLVPEALAATQASDGLGMLDPALILNIDSLMAAQISAARSSAIADSIRRAELQLNAQEALALLRKLANNDLKRILQENFPLSAENSALMALQQAAWMSHKADSLSNHIDFIELMSNFTDLVMVKKGGQSKLQPRTIAGLNTNEDFFYRLQLLKQMASPGLAFFLDQAIINSPSINSFASLWDYIRNNKWDEFQPFLPEYLQLLAQFGLDNFYSLTEQQRDELVGDLLGRRGRIWTAVGISGVSLFALILLIVLIVKRLRRKKDEL